VSKARQHDSPLSQTPAIEQFDRWLRESDRAHALTVDNALRSDNDSSTKDPPVNRHGARTASMPHIGKPHDMVLRAEIASIDQRRSDLRSAGAIRLRSKGMVGLAVATLIGLGASLYLLPTAPHQRETEVAFAAPTAARSTSPLPQLATSDGFSEAEGQRLERLVMRPALPATNDGAVSLELPDRDLLPPVQMPSPRALTPPSASQNEAAADPPSIEPTPIGQELSLGMEVAEERWFETQAVGELNVSPLGEVESRSLPPVGQPMMIQCSGDLAGALARWECQWPDGRVLPFQSNGDLRWRLMSVEQVPVGLSLEKSIEGISLRVDHELAPPWPGARWTWLRLLADGRPCLYFGTVRYAEAWRPLPREGIAAARWPLPDVVDKQLTRVAFRLEGPAAERLEWSEPPVSMAAAGGQVSAIARLDEESGAGLRFDLLWQADRQLRVKLIGSVRLDEQLPWWTLHPQSVQQIELWLTRANVELAALDDLLRQSRDLNASDRSKLRRQHEAQADRLESIHRNWSRLKLQALAWAEQIRLHAAVWIEWPEARQMVLRVGEPIDGSGGSGEEAVPPLPLGDAIGPT
jgi:hypothetical protein